MRPYFGNVHIHVLGALSQLGDPASQRAIYDALPQFEKRSIRRAIQTLERRGLLFTSERDTVVIVSERPIAGPKPQPRPAPLTPQQPRPAPTVPQKPRPAPLVPQHPPPAPLANRERVADLSGASCAARPSERGGEAPLQQRETPPASNCLQDPADAYAARIAADVARQKREAREAAVSRQVVAPRSG